jgi:hypothetical protein
MLREQPGVHSVKVALLAERGVIEYDPGVWDTDKLIEVNLSLQSHFSSSNFVTRKFQTSVLTPPSSLRPVQT